jgi:hypothetical protein
MDLLAQNIQYVSAPQANIYFNGILIDECYDIQYAYREAKEPVYGYLSQHFDAVLRGTVIITGALTINYKHDQYLTKVLQKINNPYAQTLGKRYIPTELKTLQYMYSDALVEYSEALKKQQDLKKKLAEANRRAETATNNINRTSSNLENNISLKSKAADDYLNTLSMSDKSLAISGYQAWQDYYKLKDESEKRIAELTNEIFAYSEEDTTGGYYTDMAAEAKSEMAGIQAKLQETLDAIPTDTVVTTYKNLKDDILVAQEESSSFRNDLAAGNAGRNADGLEADFAKEDAQAIAKELEQLDLSAIRDKIRNIKADMGDLTITDIELQKEISPFLYDNYNGASLDSLRAETVGKGFTIEFNYNGAPHKRLLECHLLGHGHAVSHSGMPVKEQYTFLARKFE